LHTYRDLLKTVKRTFLHDQKVYQAAVQETRMRFRIKSSNLEEDLKLAAQVKEFLTKNVVQGELVNEEKSLYRLRVNGNHVTKEGIPIM